MVIRWKQSRTHAAPILLLLGITAFSAPASAFEFGVDLGVTVQDVDGIDENVILVGAPAPDGIGIFSLQTARLGFPTSPRGQIETTFGFSLTSFGQSGGGRRNLGHVLLGVGFLHSVGDPKTALAPYLRGSLETRHVAATDAALRSQYAVSAALGLRRQTGSVLGIRVELGVARWIANDDYVGHWDPSLRAGISAFTK